MKTVTYAETSVRPSGKGHIEAIHGVLKALDSSLLAVLDIPLSWHRRIADRHALRAMDDRLLKDIGISRADAEQEAVKPFWRN
jgi:uncharacterized protein YjiS (DUF1127 family)